VIDTFGGYYPELVKEKATILEIINEEETAFSSMLDRGISYFMDLESEMKQDGNKVVAGEKAFFLYDTLGFPIDLTQQMAEEAGFEVDVQGFENQMEEQKQRSRDARNAAKSGGAVRLELIAEQTSWLAKNGIATTNDDSKYDWDIDLSATVAAIYTEEGFLEAGKKAVPGDNVGIILDKSSFYAEAGGQEADIGIIELESAKFKVMDVQVYGGYLLHTGTIEEGQIEVGASAKCKVDYDRRRDIAPNHSMTHVLNAALKSILGDGVDQRGSLCNDEKLRFDFSYKNALSIKQLQAVEELCQKTIADKEEVTSKVMPLEEAKAIDGVRAVFGEVYPDPVRVITVGADTSIEFCGGTHVKNTAEAEAFAIVEETAVAKGIRRISAVTKSLAKQAIELGASFELKVSEIEKLPADTEGLDKTAGALRKELDSGFISAVLKANLRGRIEAVQKKGVEAKKRALAQRVDRVMNVVKEQLTDAANKGVTSLVLNVDIGADSKASQKVMKAAQTIAPSMAFMGISEEEQGSGGKVMAFALVPDALIENGLKADEWVRATLEVCGGRGGGRPTNAQGQAAQCDDIEAVISASKKFVVDKIGAKV
jgi:Alanyl-tRNA synthetase